MKLKLLRSIASKALEVSGVVATKGATGEVIAHRKKRATLSVVAVGLLVDLGLDIGIAQALVDLVTAVAAAQ